MQCQCGKNAVYYRRHEGSYLCKSHFIKSFEKIVKRSIRKHNYIEKGDKIALGLSGGKDSSVLLYILHNLVKDRRDIELFAISVDEGIKGYRKDSLEIAAKLCKKLGVEHHIISFKKFFGKSLDEKIKISKDFTACTYCGVARRYILNKKAREFGANKLALGHNLDDESQSIIMNYLRGDLLRLVRMDPDIKPLKSFIKRIKPLRAVSEKEIGLYALLKGLKVQEDECPNLDGLRFEIRDFLNNIEKNHAGTKINILQTFDKIVSILKKEIKHEGKLIFCEKCGEPSSDKICKTCDLWIDIN